jgi:hypothetical protein
VDCTGDEVFGVWTSVRKPLGGEYAFGVDWATSGRKLLDGEYAFGLDWATSAWKLLGSVYGCDWVLFS